MLEDVADRVFKELTGQGYDPRMHETDVLADPLEIRLRGTEFDIDDFKALVKVGEEFGLGLGVDENGWLTLR